MFYPIALLAYSPRALWFCPHLLFILSFSCIIHSIIHTIIFIIRLFTCSKQLLNNYLLASKYCFYSVQNLSWSHSLLCSYSAFVLTVSKCLSHSPTNQPTSEHWLMNLSGYKHDMLHPFKFDLTGKIEKC